MTIVHKILETNKIIYTSYRNEIPDFLKQIIKLIHMCVTTNIC